eukprot:scaffold166790_cov26-Tisochrysis_lutea.AAC.3
MLPDMERWPRPSLWAHSRNSKVVQPTASGPVHHTRNTCGPLESASTCSARVGRGRASRRDLARRGVDFGPLAAYLRIQ